MRIAYITSGAAGMYCGSCMRDNTLASALIALGHDCFLIPTYTPIRTDETDVSQPRVFFGGISIYLEQTAPWFRRLPGFVSRALDAPWLIRLATSFGIKTQPALLGDLTLSMLQGLDGNQKRDVVNISTWLQADIRPEIVCFTNVLISGMIPEMKRQLGVPILVTLQGDDIFLDWLPEPYRSRAFELIAKNVEQVDGFITTSQYYADFMRRYLRLGAKPIKVVLPGIDLKGYPLEPPERRSDSNQPLTIGYLARICPEKGTHLLIEAAAKLRQHADCPPWQLKVAGYLGPQNREFLGRLQKLTPFEYLGELSHAQKVEFLRRLDVFTVPTTYREPKGLYVLEAQACGVPVIQPAHGSFPELLAATQGGVLVPPDNVDALAEALHLLLSDPDRRRSLGARGQAAVRDRFHAARMAEDTLAIFQRYATRDSSRAQSVSE